VKSHFGVPSVGAKKKKGYVHNYDMRIFYKFILIKLNLLKTFMPE